MAEKRMFTKKVTDSDEFISTSSSCQALYMHLCMDSDDDGFNNKVQMAMFKAHASIDDLKILLAKRFLLQFDNGVVVIKHWRMANALRKDRYTPTNFQDELNMLNIKDNGAYTEGWLPNGCQMVAVDKYSIDKNSILNNKGKKTIPTVEEIKKYIDEKGYKVDAQQFFDYYDANAWKDKDGKAVKSWKQKVITWNGRAKDKVVTKGNKFHNFEERKTNLDADIMDNFDKLMENL